MEKKILKIAILNITQGLIDRGAEVFVKELSERLEKNYEVRVEVGSKVPPRRWPILWRFFIDPNGLFILWWTITKVPLLSREKFDVIIPLNGGWQPAIVRIITWFYGGKMIISGHSGMGWDDEVNLLAFPNAFVALSTRAKNWAKRLNPFVRVEYIPNGVDLEKFKLGGKKRKIDLPRPIILCVAALTKNKRVDLAIKAVSKMSNGSLVVAGDGPERKSLDKLGDKLLGERFNPMGAIPYSELPKIYRAVDLFTLPSASFQSFEIVLVEAMATNLPVVANDDQIRREIVGSGGLLINPEDTDTYARTLENALEIRWGNRPRKQAEKFSWDKIAEKYEELLRNI